MKDQKFSISKRIRSFKFAFNGLSILIKEEHNSRIHIVFSLCAIAAGFLLCLTLLEWTAIIFAIGFVFTSEILNSAIENIADFISPEKHDKIKTIKDLGAAAVLISAITALAIALIIFLPKILHLFTSN